MKPLDNKTLIKLGIANYIEVPSNAKPLVKTSMVWGTAPASGKVKPVRQTKKTTPATQSNN